MLALAVCADSSFFFLAFLPDRMMGREGGMDRAGWDHRVEVVVIMVLCESTWTPPPPSSPLLSLFRLSRPK